MSSKPKAKILVDLIHTHNQNPVDHKLEWGNYNYYTIHAFYRLFKHLQENEYEWQAVRRTPTTPELTYSLLEQYNLLFINLLNLEDPSFTEDEQKAIHKYLSHGGSVFIITDHTNCYNHAEKINPILLHYGIFIDYTSAIESYENCVAPPGWISISRFTSHPINRGIERISFQLGGTLRTAHGTAFLSEHGYGDFWNPQLFPHFSGDRLLTLPPSFEPQGHLPVVACVDNIGWSSLPSNVDDDDSGGDGGGGGISSSISRGGISSDRGGGSGGDSNLQPQIPPPPHLTMSTSGVAITETEQRSSSSSPSSSSSSSSSMFGDLLRFRRTNERNIEVERNKPPHGGRLVVVADQNIYGDVWLHYHDNFKHALNIVEWLCHHSTDDNNGGDNGGGDDNDGSSGMNGGDRKYDDRTMSTPLRDSLPSGVNIAVDSYYSNNLVGRLEDSAFYSFYVNFNRDAEMTAHAIFDPTFQSPIFDSMKAIVVLPLLRSVPDATPILKYLENDASRTLVILADLRNITMETLNFIRQIDDEFTLNIHYMNNTQHVFRFGLHDGGGGDQLTADQLGILRSVPRFQITSRLYSNEFDVSNVTLSSYFFATVTSDWGEPFLQTQGTFVFDIARKKKNVIIFLQNEFWCNGYLGANEAQQPIAASMSAVNLQYLFIQYLKHCHRRDDHHHRHHHRS